LTGGTVLVFFYADTTTADGFAGAEIQPVFSYENNVRPIPCLDPVAIQSITAEGVVNIGPVKPGLYLKFRVIGLDSSGTTRVEVVII
jgi:hypothetical protein